MRTYIDASALVAVLTDEPLSHRAKAFMVRWQPSLVLSDFAEAEFASTLSRRLRTHEVSRQDALDALATLDVWAAGLALRPTTQAADVQRAAQMLRRLDLTLRTPDALNIAIAERCGATLLTFDAEMAAAARSLGLAVANAYLRSRTPSSFSAGRAPSRR